MALETFSVFYYLPDLIDASNNKLNFSEGGPELTAEISAGRYSMEQFVTAIQTALNAAGGLTYFVTFFRDTRKIKIEADGNFEILANTGSQVGVSPFSIMGFDAVDLSGADNYTGTNTAGEEYKTQFKLQDYVGPGEFVEKVDENINESTSGNVEVISFGEREFLEFTLKYITDRPMDNSIIRSNDNGVADAKAFLRSIINRGDFEFMPDSLERETFYTVKLESTPSNSAGVGYRLREMVGDNLPGFYEIGPIKLRVVQ